MSEPVYDQREALYEAQRRTPKATQTSPPTLRELVRGRLADLVEINTVTTERSRRDALKAADAILREFRVQPVTVGKVTGEGEVEKL